MSAPMILETLTLRKIEVARIAGGVTIYYTETAKNGLQASPVPVEIRLTQAQAQALVALIEAELR